MVSGFWFLKTKIDIVPVTITWNPITWGRGRLLRNLRERRSNRGGAFVMAGFLLLGGGFFLDRYRGGFKFALASFFFLTRPYKHSKHVKRQKNKKTKNNKDNQP